MKIANFCEICHWPMDGCVIYPTPSHSARTVITALEWAMVQVIGAGRMGWQLLELIGASEVKPLSSGWCETRSFGMSCPDHIIYGMYIALHNSFPYMVRTYSHIMQYHPCMLPLKSAVCNTAGFSVLLTI